jgi:uncharacterized protein
LAIIDTVLLKVASRCNLDCTYCYVFNMGDETWRAQPKRMSHAVEGAVIAQLADLASRQSRPFSVVLHGGEPLLLGVVRLNGLLSRLRAALSERHGLHIQTNGVLLTADMIDVCARHRVGISISLDGSIEVNDRYRVDHRGRGSHARVLEAIRRLKAHPNGAALFSGLLAVVDPTTDPGSIYAFFKSVGTPSVDFLYRDGNHDILPFGKCSLSSTEYGKWMSALLDLYLADESPPRIRILDDMLKLLLGGAARKEGVGLIDYGILIIDTDGAVRKNDTLKSAGNGADRFGRPWSIIEHQLHEIVASPEFESYHAAQRATASVCLACPDLTVCGGGMQTHRWSMARKFDNPSVFCADQRLLIGRMREWIEWFTKSAA